MNTYSCGHIRTVKNTDQNMTTGNRCLTCSKDRAKRNAAMIDDWLGGMVQTDVAEKYDISVSRLSVLIRRSGAVLSTAEHGRRVQAGIKTTRGRKPAWPDCPAHLKHEYMRLRKSYGISAQDARAAIEKDMAV